ncbi:MAG TPA: restriction endonuclease [Dehalococcoidia bacterium]|nr:restriction endonuclease [Dehalococcoidia bacterium]
MRLGRKLKEKKIEDKESNQPLQDAKSENSYDTDEEVITIEPNTLHLWKNPKAVKLVSWLLSHKDARIDPEINLQSREGYNYRTADDIMETSGKTTWSILESLAEKNVLLKDDFERILLTLDGSIQLIPVERCPNCDSAHLSRGKMIEHFACGHVGFEEDFVSGLKTVCPKCKKELKLIGTDYRNPGLRYTCKNCQGIFPLPTIKYRCLKTGEIYSLEELNHVWLYSYRLNENCRTRLEFELEPKKRFVDYLYKLGYSVQESMKLQGKSGATHTIDLLATMDDPIARHTVAIGILAAPQGEEAVNIDSLFSLDSKIYDIGIKHKIVLAVPRLAPDAKKFAERQGIRVYGLEELGALLSGQTDVPTPANRETQEIAGESEMEPELSKLGPKGFLKYLLEKKGYMVTENARVTGRSGVEHTLELYAQKDDGITSHQVAACVILSGHNDGNGVNEVVQFDTAAYDAGITDKVIITIPRLSKAAKQFAEYQHIKVLEAKDLIEFSNQFLDSKTNTNNKVK